MHLAAIHGIKCIWMHQLCFIYFVKKCHFHMRLSEMWQNCCHFTDFSANFSDFSNECDGNVFRWHIFQSSERDHLSGFHKLVDSWWHEGGQTMKNGIKLPALWTPSRCNHFNWMISMEFNGFMEILIQNANFSSAIIREKQLIFEIFCGMLQEKGSTSV